MTNPFSSRAVSLSGPATDIIPVVPNDATDLATPALSLYVQQGGVISLVSLQGVARSVEVADFSILPVAVLRVNATGTTASGIHALVVV